MSERSPHASTQSRHEDSYRKTVRVTLENIRRGSYTEEAVPRILDQLRGELGQCVELLLISPEFYGQQMQLIGAGVEELMEA